MLPKAFDTDDLRITTMAFANGAVPTVKLVELARRNLRIKLLLTDPTTGEWLIRVRNRIRPLFDRETEEHGLREVRDQILKLRGCVAQIKELKNQKGCTGDLQLYLSTLMPYAFAAITRQFVILGLFIATGSYGQGR